MKRNAHGHTPAGWYGAAVIVVGFVLGAFGVGAYSLVLTIIGAAVTLAGIGVALVLQHAGLGQFPPQHSHSVESAEQYLGRRRDGD